MGTQGIMLNSLRVVFMGSPKFALPACIKLYETFDVVGVMTAPDAIRGRGKKLVETPVAAFASSKNIPIYKTTRINDAAFSWLVNFAPDVICVVAFGALLPKRVLDLPRYGCINVHASLLPAWRGAAPIERAILAGDAELGVSIMQMQEGLDEGDYCLQASIRRDDKSSAAIHTELSQLGASLLCDCLKGLDTQTLTWIKQPKTNTSYAAKLEKSEFRLCPQDGANKNFLRVQASSSSYPAKFVFKQVGIRVMEAKPVATEQVRSGQLYEQEGHVYLGCNDQTALELICVKPDGKQTMQASAWARGSFQKGEPTWQ